MLAGPDDPDALWLATTDADTLVAPPWLARHLRHRAGGAELLLGTVDVRRGTLTARRRALWRLDYARRIRRRTHWHVHGANLGISARAYLELGGFRPWPTTRTSTSPTERGPPGCASCAPPTWQC
ncbi:hypothetical protein NBM05_15100 [Rothia sp. AR01]|uniref:Glycosyltransferase 2-like domain-containing protein n=1 Tax=Rothia santali TaxID=2949643 RepID=A0A9X2KJJ6_9MICC|nr:hypothetical protein [Rothia santali]MCP3427298.1 hypothetical protein [Rothia santali]